MPVELILLAALLVIGPTIGKGLAQPFAGLCEEEVRRRGGSVLRREVRMFLRGPFGWFAGQRHVVKVVYQARDGRVLQLWARAPGLFGAEPDLVWDYDDGNSDPVRGVWRLLNLYK